MQFLTTMGGVGAGWLGWGPLMRAPAIFLQNSSHIEDYGNVGAGSKPALNIWCVGLGSKPTLES